MTEDLDSGPSVPPIDFGPLGSDATQAINRLIRSGRRNFMLAGAPGTGKTVLAKQIKGSNDGVEVQFHPAFSYEDFIEGLRPNTDPDDRRQFIPAPGLFAKAIGTFTFEDGEPKAADPSSAIANYISYAHKTGSWDWDLDENSVELPPFYFIIDEINRANLPRVFGEALSQIDEDKRPSNRNPLTSHPVTLPNSGHFFVVPPHVIILSTMNTADRSIKSIDAAILRRFAKLTVGLDSPALARQAQDKTVEPWSPARVTQAYQRLNEMARDTLDRQNSPFGDRWFELGVGPSYFWPTETKPFDDQFFEDALNYDVLPYLESVLEPSDAQKIVKELLVEFGEDVPPKTSAAGHSFKRHRNLHDDFVEVCRGKEGKIVTLDYLKESLPHRNPTGVLPQDHDPWVPPQKIICKCNTNGLHVFQPQPNPGSGDWLVATQLFWRNGDEASK